MPAPAQTAADATLGKLTLRVRGPAGTTQTVVLTSACCRIGSGDDCTLRLRAPGIRDVHCIISRGPRRTVVRGLAKETWLNGTVFFESPLSVGDCLRLGRLEIDVLSDERLADEAEADGFREPTLSPEGAVAGSRPEGASSDEISVESTSSAEVSRKPAEAAALPTDIFGHLQELLADQTAESANFAANALEKVRGVEDRLGRLEEQSGHFEEARDEIRALRTAWEDASRQRQAEYQQAEETWRHSLADLDRRVRELAAAPVVPLPGAGGSEPATDWRQFDDRLAVVERLLGQEDQHSTHTSKEVESLLERVAQMEARIAAAEASGRVVASGLSRVERLEGQLADLAGRQETTRQHATSSPTAWDDLRQEWAARLTDLTGSLDELRQQMHTLAEEFRDRSRDQSAAYAELQQRCATLETALAAVGSRESAGNAWAGAAGVGAISEAVDRAPSQHLSHEPAETEPQAGEEPEEQELAFEPVSHEAPLSTLDVLRRMGATVNLSDDEESSSPPPRAAARPVPAHPPAERPKPAAAQPEHHGGQHEDGGAIEQYMSQLLQRMRSPNAERAPAANPPPAAEPPAAPKMTSEAAPAAASPLPPPSTQFVPRAMAPELAADFSAMRALANNTARQAIDTHHRHRQVRSTRGKLVLAGVTLVISFLLLWLSTSGHRVALWSAFASLLVSVYWGSRYLLLTRQLRSKAEADDAGDCGPAGEGPSASEQSKAAKKS